MATRMLDDLILPSRANQIWQYSGMDCLERCIDRKHFKKYPYSVEYRYNTRGFRDNEWPDDLCELKQAIWCIGDSFTVGVGQPFDHIWPQILQKETQCRTINIAMDGASNNWISRRALDIVRTINPQHLVIMWSYVERRELTRQQAMQKRWQAIYNEIRDSSWPDIHSLEDIEMLPQDILTEIKITHGINLPLSCHDDDLLIHQDTESSDEEHYNNWQNCVDQMLPFANIVHCVIPDFVFNTKSNQKFWHYLAARTDKCLPPINRIDWARDGHHFDILTARQIVAHLLPFLTP